MGEILVMSTADSPDLAHRIARELVERGEAACVSIVPGLRSIYRWEGRICDEGELLLLIKSRAERFDAIRATIREIHSYQTPEVLALSIAAGDSDYLRWLRQQVSPDPCARDGS
jgi:periplasmic divalent cation tolerance protein